MGQAGKDKLRPYLQVAQYRDELFLWQKISFELGSAGARQDLVLCLWCTYKMDKRESVCACLCVYMHIAEPNAALIKIFFFQKSTYNCEKERREPIKKEPWDSDR